MKVNTEEEYKKALEKLENIDWESKEFDELCDAIEKYEDVHYPIPDISQNTFEECCNEMGVEIIDL